ncbi:MAG: RND family efflux transporter MFP subunit [Alphaproteobacteria bacterium]|jgi:RND family efflux transporter MFP subunit
MRFLIALTAVTLTGVALSGCGEAETKSAPLPPRAIKYMKIGSDTIVDRRTFAGVVRAGTRSNVAFEAGGRILQMSAEVGNEVHRGELLARLDPKPLQLQVSQAEFTLKQAIASLNDARSKHGQQKTLWDKRLSTRTAYDTALANFRNAEGQIGIARDQLELRKRDLEKSKLMAPFAGRIAEKKAEVFEEIKAGEAIYIVQTEGENEVQVSIPEAVISSITMGQLAKVKFPPLNGASADARVTEISPQAGDANAFPVILRLVKSPDGLRPGMSAETTFSFDTERRGKAFSVPVGALKPDVSNNTALVFVFDAAKSIVNERPVRVVGINGNNPQIVGAIKPGDIIATAGVGHMYDGMKVRLLDLKKPF